MNFGIEELKTNHSKDQYSMLDEVFEIPLLSLFYKSNVDFRVFVVRLAMTSRHSCGWEESSYDFFSYDSYARSLLK